MDDDVDLAGSWLEFWRALSGGSGEGLTRAAAWLGLIIIIGALIVFFWRKTRGRVEEGTTDGWILWAVLFGAVLAAPGFVMPAILTLIDVVANTGIGLWQASQNQSG